MKDKLLAAILSLSVYFLLLFSLFYYFGYRSASEKSEHYVNKKSKSISVTLGGPSVSVSKNKKSTINKKSPKKPKTKKAPKKHQSTPKSTKAPQKTKIKTKPKIQKKAKQPKKRPKNM